jgi:hypothetical protein
MVLVLFKRRATAVEGAHTVPTTAKSISKSLLRSTEYGTGAVLVEAVDFVLSTRRYLYQKGNPQADS